MSDFHLVMKKVKVIVQQIDACAGSDVAALRTASYVLSQAHEQSKAFSRTMTEASNLYIANIITASRICIMREVSQLSISLFLLFVPYKLTHFLRYSWTRVFLLTFN